MESLKEIVDVCCKRVNEELSKKGVNDVFTCKVKKFKGYRDDWMALYRSFSQFSSRPIFWVNEDTMKIIKKSEKEFDSRINPYDVVCDDIRHEYGHVIGEWGKKRNQKITEIIEKDWTDEEDFAEGFKDYISDSAWADNEESYDKVMDLFKKDMKKYYK